MALRRFVPGLSDDHCSHLLSGLHLAPGSRVDYIDFVAALTVRAEMLGAGLFTSLTPTLVRTGTTPSALHRSDQPRIILIGACTYTPHFALCPAHMRTGVTGQPDEVGRELHRHPLRDR